PASAASGGPPFTLSVNGAGFVPTSQLKFNGKAEPTTYVSSQLVTASVAAVDIAIAGTATVTVTNSGPGGGPSNALSFNVTGISVSPNMGTGSTQTFGVSVFDPNGVADVKTLHLLFNTTSASQASACSVYYLPGTNQLYLYGDNGTTLLGPVTPGAAATLTNSQCTLNAIGTSVDKSGNTLKLRPMLTFKSTFIGLKNIYVYTAAGNGTSA